MVNHIIQLIEGLIKKINKQENGNNFSHMEYFQMITEELNKLDTLNFSPNDRHDFILDRQSIRIQARLNGYSYSNDTDNIAILNRLLAALRDYGKLNNNQFNNDFNFIHNLELKILVERDYKELIHILMPDGAWKSAVILAGSILEAILHDQLTNDCYKQLALTCESAPKYQGNVKPIDKWKLVEMITVAEKIECLPSQRAKSIDQVLRDYRNFVHPLVEVKSQHPCTQAEALMAQGALEAVINHFNLMQESFSCN